MSTEVKNTNNQRKIERYNAKKQHKKGLVENYLHADLKNNNGGVMKHIISLIFDLIKELVISRLNVQQNKNDNKTQKESTSSIQSV